MESQFGIEQRQVAPLLSYVMNKLAGQKWEPPTEESEKLDCCDVEENQRLGKRANVKDLTYILSIFPLWYQSFCLFKCSVGLPVVCH